mgnify:CR=1 FL=1
MPDNLKHPIRDLKSQLIFKFAKRIGIVLSSGISFYDIRLMWHIENVGVTIQIFKLMLFKTEF